MGNAGIVYTHAYGAHLCVPSRATLISGRWSQRQSVGNIFGNNPVLPPAVNTIAERHRAMGYRTVMAGKWHLGTTQPRDPIAQGFDSFFGWLRTEGRYLGAGGPPFFRNRTVISVPLTAYTPYLLADEIVGALSRPHSQPVFAYVPMNSAHYPLQAPQALLNRVPASTPGNDLFSATIMGFDDVVGRIVAAAKPGTLIFIMGDNGNATNAPFKGRKETLYEGGIRIPLFVWHKGVSEHRIVSTPVSVVDILPTALAAAGGSLATDLDGVNILGSVPSNRPIFFQDIHRHGFAVRRGPWKLLLDYDGKATQLYNILDDQAEAHNVAGTNPAIVNELRGLINGWKRTIEN